MTRPLGASGHVFPKPTQSKLPDSKRKDMPAGLWTKCPGCATFNFNKELEKFQMVCKGCQHHFPIMARKRIEAFLDRNSWVEHDADLQAVDALAFPGYGDSLKKYQKKMGMNDSVVSGLGKIGGIPISLAVMEFHFIGGSMGVVAGEKITRAVERATELGIAVVIFCASGGARMQEGMFSLLQMGKTSGALSRHAAKKLPFIAVLTDPTTGGVTASFATLGDVILAEPKAQIGFAGKQVIKETINQQLPEGFQTAEFLLERGLIDRIVPRAQLRVEIGTILEYFMHTKAVNLELVSEGGETLHVDFEAELKEPIVEAKSTRKRKSADENGAEEHAAASLG